MIDRVTRLLAATVLAAAGTTVLAPAPASAASCATPSGVTVVVDFHELGRGVQAVCDAGGGGKYASALFGESGFPLTPVQREPGFVCRVDGAPEQETCVNTPPADAYWGLWWSSGTSGSWTYATTGVDSLKIPVGGSVAFSWNGGSTKSPPRSTPPSHASSPSPKPTPSPTPTPTPTPKSTPSPASSSPGGGTGGAAGHSAGGATGHAASGPGGDRPSGSADPGAAGTSGTARRDRPSASSPSASDTPAARTARAVRRGPARRESPARDRTHPRAKGQAPASPAPSPGTLSASAARATPVSADQPGTGGDALPAWLAPAGIAALFVAAGGTALVRRRRQVVRR